MKRVDPKAFYSLREAVDYTPLNARETLSRYVNRYQGAEWSKGELQIKLNKGKTAKRYLLSGKWIREFNKRYKAGKLVDHTLFTPDEVRYTLQDILNYCKKNKLITVKEYIEAKQKEETGV